METKTYQTKNGEIRLLHGTFLFKREIRYRIHQFLYLFIYLFLLFLTFYITLIIYKTCIINLSLENTITLGAVFATLGSSLVAIFSLTCSEQYSQFMDNVRILETELLKKNHWERWPFVKRFWRSKVAKGEFYYYILCNPAVIFKDPYSDWQISFPLPFGKVDFRELPVYKNLIRLVKNKYIYNNIIMKNNTIQDILIWDCLTDIYKNIILYRWCQMFVWIGSCFVLGSILFSFFYIYIEQIIGVI